MGKRIRIEHASNPLNYGTNMMVTNFMYYLDKHLGVRNEYLLDVYNDEDLRNFRNQYKEGNIKRETIDYTLTYSNNIVEKAINKIKRKIAFKYFYNKKVDKLKNNTDTLVILGGDDLSEYYQIDALKRELSRIREIKKIIKTFLVGQTIGPFYNERIEIAKESLKDIQIYSRDPWTTNYLKNNLHVSGCKESADLALLPLPYQDNIKIKENILNKYALKSEEYITLVVSGLYHSYCEDKQLYIDNWIKVINYLKNKFRNKKIVFLPHVLRNEQYDDRNMIKELQQRLSEEEYTYIYDEMMPLEARFILGNGMFTITGRMHAAISTFQSRKPAISISYSVKYNGVIGESLKLSNSIVDGSGTAKWNNYGVANEVINKVEYMLKNDLLIKQQINESISKAEVNIYNMIKEISTKIKQ